MTVNSIKKTQRKRVNLKSFEKNYFAAWENINKDKPLKEYTYEGKFIIKLSKTVKTNRNYSISITFYLG